MEIILGHMVLFPPSEVQFGENIVLVEVEVVDVPLNKNLLLG